MGANRQPLRCKSPTLRMQNPNPGMQNPNLHEEPPAPSAPGGARGHTQPFMDGAGVGQIPMSHPWGPSSALTGSSWSLSPAPELRGRGSRPASPRLPQPPPRGPGSGAGASPPGPAAFRASSPRRGTCCVKIKQFGFIFACHV